MTNEFINNMLEVDEAYRCAFGDHSNHVHPAEVVDEPDEKNPEEETPKEQSPEEGTEGEATTTE